MNELALAGVETFEGRVTQADALTLLRSLPDACADAVICDPPYGMGIDKWDKKQDSRALLRAAMRVIKPQGFVIFFHMLPLALDWLNAADDLGLLMKDHITWVKRKHTAIFLELMRSKEEIFIYSKKRTTYFQTQGFYEDVKLPGVMFDVISIEGIDRHIKNLHAVIEGKGGNVTRVSKKFNWYASFESLSNRSPRSANFTNVWSFLPENTKTLGNMIKHPSVKPVLLMQRLIELTTPKQGLVVDPYAGSFTTAVAAVASGRRWIGCDISPEYCEIGRERLARGVQLNLFDCAAVGAD